MNCQRVGDGTPECPMRECVFEKGGATRAAAVATCAQVYMRVVGLVDGTAVRSCDVHCLRWRSRLADSAINGVGLQLYLVMVALLGALIGLPVGISVGTLRIGACGCMDRVIHLLSLVWGIGHASWCNHPWNLLSAAKMFWGNGFFILVGICLYVCLCCINNTV